ncbi:MAG: hypothetical protein ACRDA4_00065 [Filifactoraceae bacterium]
MLYLRLSKNYHRKLFTEKLSQSQKTFSAATSSAIDIKNHFDAIVIGEETGGNVNFTTINSNTTFNLPNSNLQIKLSSKTYWL